MNGPTIAMVATPDDGSCGVGTYAGDLRSYLDCEVSHIELQTNSTNPFHFASVAIAAGTAETDIVHVQHEYGLFGRLSLFWWIFAPILWIAALIRSVPVVLTLHEAWDEETVGTRLPRLQVAYVYMVNISIALVADHLLFLSETREEAYIGATPLQALSTSQFPHGVNVDETRDIPQNEAKATFGYDSEETVIVEPGYVSKQKGADVFVKLAERIPDYEFLLAGGARNPGDRQFIESLDEQSPSNLKITGKLSSEAFHSAFLAADLVVLPYRKDGQSGVFNWSAAYGRPVAGSNCDYFREMNEDWGCVSLFDPDDLDDTENTVRQLLEEGTTAELAAAMRTFREANRFESVAKQHQRLYRELL